MLVRCDSLHVPITRARKTSRAPDGDIRSVEARKTSPSHAHGRGRTNYGRTIHSKWTAALHDSWKLRACAHATSYGRENACSITTLLARGMGWVPDAFGGRAHLSSTDPRKLHVSLRCVGAQKKRLVPPREQAVGCSETSSGGTFPVSWFWLRYLVGHSGGSAL